MIALKEWSTMIADQLVLLRVTIKMTSSIASLCVYQVGSRLVYNEWGLPVKLMNECPFM